ncbi:MAG TPA: hypothetical protein VF173_08575 [Thermoanaerobaculia bacterium]|nr:hypothetical protein [Thermoanaerobaculia bacterium]
MSSEVFRFVTLRPPQQVDSDAVNVIDLGLSPSPFTNSLRSLRIEGSRSDMVALVTKFLVSDDFIDSPAKLDQPLADFIATLHRLPDPNFWAAAGQEFARIFNAAPAEVATTDALRTAYVRSSDSIVAATIAGSVSPKVRGLLVRTARTLWLIGRLGGTAPLSRSVFLNAPLVLPEGIFPLPVADAGLSAQRQTLARTSQAATEARRTRTAQLAADLAAHRQAAEELLSTFEQAGAQPAPNPAARSTAAASGGTAPVGFLLPDAAAESLSEATKAALKTVGVAATQIDVAKAVALLERQAASLAKQLYAGTGATGTMVRVGNRILPKDALAGGLAVDPGLDDNRTPGSCPPAPATSLPEDSVTVPTGHGDARILGIADLMVVEQDLLRYQLGEIAHIENVLRSEVRSREFKVKDTTEQTLTTETETTGDKEKDLSSTERFELQTESQTVISENASKEAGLTIHASYGPSVDATANFNASSSTSTQQSNAASSSFAREIATKAVDRVQTRTLTRRTVTTTHVVEDNNLHSFDNKSGNSDIVGVYRFVDKIYQAQIVSYGKRLMLEFIVPEPAAFLRFALTNKPVDNVSLVNPEPPGYCVNGTTFVPLQASDITRDNYLFWVSKYGAQDATPPPPSLIIASGSKKAPDTLPTIQDDGERKINSDLFDVDIADGYLCQSAFVNIFGETQAGIHKIVFQIQDQQAEYVEPVDDNHLFFLHLQPTPRITVSINSVGFHNYEILANVFCTLSTEKLQEWQLKTFASIMNAYNGLKSAFDQAIQEARLQAADTTVSGTNPETNRVTEQTELKKACISLLTGQRFDLFDAVTRNVAPFGYPEIDFAEAKAEGAYIQRFEQSFEWNNMVYLFYPYFWGKKDFWVTVAQLTDPDPLFAQFLQAGAARVQVPVRLGFEAAILTYLATGELWAGEGTLVNSDGGDPDPLHLSIVDEIKSQNGNNNTEGVGTLSVTKGSAAVAGSGTAFTTDDEKRRIVIAGTTYVIKTVQSEQAITLTTPYTGTTDQGLGYAIGGKLVGQPWEVKLPTDLIKLDSSLVIS